MHLSIILIISTALWLIVPSVSGLCTTIPVNVRGQNEEVHKSLLETHPKSHLTNMLKDYKCGDDPIFIDRDPKHFRWVLKFMRYGRVTNSEEDIYLGKVSQLPSFLTDLIIELDFYWPYDSEADMQTKTTLFYAVKSRLVLRYWMS